MTLLELLVVIAILVALAAAVLPLLGDAQKRASTGVAASTIADAARYVETYRALHSEYADNWDTLATATAAPATLYGKLSPQITSGTLLAAPAVLPDAVYQSIRLTGVNHIQAHDAAAEGPSDSGTISAHLIGHSGATAGVPLVTLDVTSVDTDGNGRPDDGNDGWRLLALQWNVPQDFIDGHAFVAFGFGPKNEMVGELVQTAPLVDDAGDPGRFYGRVIAVFAVPNDGTVEAGTLVGVVGPGGHSVASSISAFHAQGRRDH